MDEPGDGGGDNEEADAVADGRDEDHARIGADDRDRGSGTDPSQRCGKRPGTGPGAKRPAPQNGLDDRGDAERCPGNGHLRDARVVRGQVGGQKRDVGDVPAGEQHVSEADPPQPHDRVPVGERSGNAARTVTNAAHAASAAGPASATGVFVRPRPGLRAVRRRRPAEHRRQPGAGGQASPGQRPPAGVVAQ